jgi:virginiamycin B lyase
VRRLAFDENGIIWGAILASVGWAAMTTSLAMSGNAAPPAVRDHPYAIAVFDGAVWHNESGVRPDMLVRFDTEIEQFQSWPIPSGPIYAGILRQMRTSPDGEALLMH